MKRSAARLYGMLLGMSFAHAALAGDLEDYERLKRVAAEKSKLTIQQLVAERAAGIVTIKFILRHSFMGEQSKEEMEAPGIMVSVDGLVLGANSTMMGLASELGDYLSDMGAEGPTGTAETVDYRITVGAETDEYPAKLIARDSDLDLAWLQVSDAKGKTFQHIDFAAGLSIELGDRYLTLLRLADRFERAPVVYEGVIGGAIQRPRPLLVAGFGVPPGSVVLNEDGRAAGFVISQPPEKGDPGAVSEDYMSAMVTFVLPASKVVQAMAQAREAAKKQAVEP